MKMYNNVVMSKQLKQRDHACLIISSQLVILRLDHVLIYTHPFVVNYYMYLEPLCFINFITVSW